MKLFSKLMKIMKKIYYAPTRLILIIALLASLIFTNFYIWISTFIILLVVKIIYPLLKKIKVKECSKVKDEPIHINQKIDGQYTNSYTKRNLLTKNEWNNYLVLKDICDKNNLIICPKVRLLDVIEPIKDQWNYQTLLHKIQAKHIDFLLCKPDMSIVAILELDDNSHNTIDRIERDAFVDEILTSVGYKIIRTRHIDENTLDDLK